MEKDGLRKNKKSIKIPSVLSRPDWGFHEERSQTQYHHSLSAGTAEVWWSEQEQTLPIVTVNVVSTNDYHWFVNPLSGILNTKWNKM